MFEGSLEVKLPTIWTNEKQGREEAERRERLEERRSEKRKSQKKEDADARKGRKVAKHCDFPMIWGSGGSKSRLAKAAGAEPAGQMRDEKVHAVVARSPFPSQNVQNTPLWTTFGSCDVEKVHAVVARSTFPSQNVQNTTCSRHFWRFRCPFASLHYTTLRYTTLQLQLHNYTTTLHYTPLHSTTLHCSGR